MEKKTTYFIILIVITALLLGILLGQFITDMKNPNMNQTQNVNINANDKENKININTATQKELESLPEIGEVKAKKIIQHRPYNNVSELLNVIGNKTYETIKDKAVVE